MVPWLADTRALSVLQKHLRARIGRRIGLGRVDVLVGEEALDGAGIAVKPMAQIVA